MSKSILRDKAKEFAKEVVFVCKDIKTEHKETVLTNQLLRCATSIGANLHESQYAQGKKDFVSKGKNFLILGRDLNLFTKGKHGFTQCLKFVICLQSVY